MREIGDVYLKLVHVNSGLGSALSVFIFVSVADSEQDTITWGTQTITRFIVMSVIIVGM